MYVFFFNDTAATEIYTLSLHDALPIFLHLGVLPQPVEFDEHILIGDGIGGHIHFLVFMAAVGRDRKSTRLNSSHANISYAVFCLKKKNSSICFTLTPFDSPATYLHISS